MTITRPDVEIYMIFDCLKGLLCLWVGTMIIKQYSTLNRRDCLWFWGGDALIFWQCPQTTGLTRLIEELEFFM